MVRTGAPSWLFERSAPRGVEIQPVDVDTGIVQIDSLRLDEDETARQAARFYSEFDRRIETEAAVLRTLGADVVLGDIPPLAFPAAQRAGLPSVAIGNFTWDWIYRLYPAFERLAPDVIPTIAEAYATATCALRLPLHGGFESMATVIDLPFIARRSMRDPADTRRRLGIASDRPVVLTSFGGYGADLPLDITSRSARFTLIPPLRDPPAGLDYEDLVAAADVVVSKPGYGIVSECIANATALLYTSRGRFAEYDVFVSEMPRVLRARYISQDDLLAGRWADAIDALLAQPPAPEHPRLDGAEVASEFISRFSSC